MILNKAFQTLGRYIMLMARVFSRPERMRMFFKQYLKEIEQLGVNSIGIVLLISFFIGAVITIQIKLNIESPWMPRWTVGYVTREILLLEFSSSIMCLILAGKVGSNIASEIGTMRVTQQIDALEIMGINSASYLILPKIVALVTIIPILVTFSIFAGIIGAFATCWFGGMNVLCSGFIFPLQGVTRSGETCHIDPVMVLVEVGGPTLAVGLAPVIQHDLCVMPDFVRHFFLLLAGKPGLEPVISQRQSKQNPGSRQVYIYQMGVAPFFIGKHGANKSLCLVQIFLVTAEAIGQRQIGDCNAHISCAFFGMFLRQDHRFIAIGLCKKPLILFFSLSRNFFAVGFQVSDKNQMARLISLFCLFFLCGPAALQPVLKGPYRTADTVLQSQTVLLESEPFQPGVPASD